MKPYYDFSKIKDKIKEYDFIIFLNDKTKYDETKITEWLEYINQNNLDQLIINNYENAPINIKEYDYYRRITKSNKIFKNLTKEEVIQKNIENNYEPLRYTLQPSIIKISNFILPEFNLKKNPHIENLYWKELINNGFKISSNSFINEKKNTIKNDKNKNKLVEICGEKSDIFGVFLYRKDKNKTLKFLKINIKNQESILFNNNSGDNLTIITGFLDTKIKRPAKSDTPNQTYDYIEKSRGTLQIPQYMIIYSSEELIENISKIREEYGLLDKTKIIKITMENNLYMIDKIDKVRENVIKNNPPYNIAEYILAVNSRYGYIENAINNNYFNTDYFAWIDFSASHIVNIPPNKKITYSSHEKVRIGLIARYHANQFIYNHYCLGGGIFVGHKKIMLELIKLHHKEFVKLMEMGYNINDDKLLFIIMEQNPHLFDIYFSDYANLFIKL